MQFRWSDYIVSRLLEINFCGPMDRSRFCFVYKYEFCCEATASQTVQIVNQAFDRDMANERTIRRWFERFRFGDFTLQIIPVVDLRQGWIMKSWKL